MTDRIHKIASMVSPTCGWRQAEREYDASHPVEPSVEKPPANRGFELFPGFKTPPNDPSRDLSKPSHYTPRLEDEEMDADDYEDGDEWCEACNNMGILN